jgi:hypothetical protein
MAPIGAFRLIGERSWDVFKSLAGVLASKRMSACFLGIGISTIYDRNSTLLRSGGTAARDLRSCRWVILAAHQQGGRRVTRVKSFANPRRGLTTHPAATSDVGVDRDAGMPGTRAAD